MKNASRRGVLTPEIELQSFKSPKGLPSPHFENVNVILTLFQKWGCDIPTHIISKYEIYIVLWYDHPHT